MADEDDLLSCLLDVAEAELNSLNKLNDSGINTNISNQSASAKNGLVVAPSNSKTRLLYDADLFSGNSKDDQLVCAKSKKSVSVNKVSSVIHSGDTDSSDEEGNRNYENQKYNECGVDIKNLLSEKLSSSNFYSGAGPSSTFKWKSDLIKKKAATSFGLPTSRSNSSNSSSNVSTETICGINIMNPHISSKVFEERMVGRKAVPIFQIGTQLKLLKKDDDWVVVGVICSKGVTKTSAKGNQFIVWTLSDLLGSIKTISLFLFGNAYKEFWKTQTGSVVGILNPGILDKREGSRDEASLSVDNAQKVLLLGQSKDLGFCKSTKKNGEKCTAIVNKTKCEFCIYHVKQEYQKCSRRSELQSNFSGKGLIALRNKVLGKNEVFYAGKSYTAIPAKQSRKLMKKDQNRLQSLSDFTRSAPTIKKAPIHKAATSFDAVRSRRIKDIERLKKLGADTEKFSISNEKEEFKANHSNQVSLSEAKANAMNVLSKLNKKTKPLQKEKEEFSSSNRHDHSQLQKSLDELVHQDLIDLDVNYRNMDDRNIISSTSVDEAQLSLSVDQNLVSIKPSDLSTSDKQKKIKGGTQASSNTVSNKEFLRDAHTSTNPLSVDQNLVSIKPSDLSTSDKQKKIKGGTQASSNTVSNKEFLRDAHTSTNSLSADQNLVSIKPSDLSTSDKQKKIKGDTQASSNTVSNKEFSRDARTSTNSSSEILMKENVTISKKPTEEPKLNFSDQLILSLNPTLSSNGGSINLNEPIISRRAMKARSNALKYVQKNGPLKKEDPNNIKGSGVKRSLDITTSESSKKLKMIQENGFMSDRFKKMMELQSKHMDLVDIKDAEEKEKYFQKLEMKEKLEEKLTSTYKIECKAVRCLNCKYTSFSAADRCKTEKHRLRVFDTVKRFFKCGNCGNRVACLDVFPILPCNNCHSKIWERTTMMKEKNVTNALPLSIRGGEQTFVNSVITDANINLMVPDED